MRPTDLWRYEVRRAGWAALLTPPVATAALLLLALLDGGDDTDRTLLAALEMVLPLAAGVGAASLVGRDPAVELQLTVPTSYRSTLLRRLAVTLGWAALLAVLVAGILLATGGMPQERGALSGQLVWLAPTVWLGGLGFLAGAAFRSPAAAGGLVTTWWIVQQVFPGLLQGRDWSRTLYLFETTRGAVPEGWAANRLTLVATALVLAGLGWALLGRAERLLREEAE
ncbi:hypothetical protein RB614_07635 [Phytohabitans sp. ZYX-F-186]|uniref:ABC transporter permease n=1 Tax=Phytohabitans maris TaxID=3071409 RepID=A0ABU0ZBH3_9ACTN|nr:hypothetical protein [Phytohabitans sp. ZYX-F-186]MDQ7904393.1 hypothetical protein [Phytohabitans sp. ZYX-F-186]